MVDENTIVKERQLAIRREMDRRHISLKAVQLDGRWENVSTVASYFPNPEGLQDPATMSVASLYRLLKTKALPADLLSMLLPDGFVILEASEVIDYDEFAAGCRSFLEAKDRAHHPESEQGRDIGPNENAELGRKVVRLPVRAA